MTSNKRLSSLLCLLCLMMCFIGLNSCVTTSGAIGATAIKAPYARMDTYKTYAWFQPQPVAESDYEKGYSANLNKSIKQAVEEELKEKGYRKVESQPDVLVAYDVSVPVPEEKDQPENFSTGFGYSYGYMSGYRYNYGNADMPGYRSVDLFKQGTLIIDLVSPQSKMLLWRGWSEGGISNFKAGYKQVKNQVEEVLEKL
ncbi:DUF4136 domain-containing protein [Pontibacter toksunensis]|uniref:DUF4136 domain-containing protein n=1 Tax=Pontibacter toksunensis TaxID=1332631 RepID=A0ABW6BPK4_9BACT